MLVYFCFVIAIVAICTNFLLCVQKVRSKKKLHTLLIQCEGLQNDLQASQMHNKSLDEKNRFLEQENIKLSTHLQIANQASAKLESTYKENIALLESRFKEAIKEQSNSILEQNKLHLMNDSKKILDESFAPLEKSIKAYAERLNMSESKMEANINHMYKYSDEISKSANKLSGILKGDKKIRGNFAETQLERLLANSGLIEGEQYKMQGHFRFEGKGYQPDAIVYLTQHKSVIIDAKFPLPDNLNINDFQITKETSIALANNLRKRIDELAKKPYREFDANTYDFVLLFIPYNNLLDLALDEDETLYKYAYERKIYLTTPHTLFMALKTIQISWYHTQSDKKIMDVLSDIKRFKYKLDGIISNFNKLKKSLESIDNNVRTIDGQIQSGAGNLSKKIEELGILGDKLEKTNMQKAQDSKQLRESKEAGVSTETSEFNSVLDGNDASKTNAMDERERAELF